MKIFTLISLFVAGFSIAESKDLSKSDFKVFSKKMATCLKKEDRACLEKLVLKKMYLSEFQNFGCNKQMLSAGEFSDCVFTSTKKFSKTSDEKTLKEILLECYTDSDTKININRMNFETITGYHCSVETEDGKIKLENITPFD